MYKHFVLTRFNLKLENHFSKDKYGKATQTAEWLKRRFSLFETFCFPSIQAQSCQQFTWIVLFDLDTPAIFKKQIEAYQSTFHKFYPLYCDSGEKEYIKQHLVHAIHSLSDEKTQFIITTRIDNDDAFHIDMIREVQSFFWNKKDDCYLNFNYGIQYDVKNCCAVRIRYENNHFISRLEKNDLNLETVIFHDHSEVNKISRVFSIENKANPMWIEGIHETNVSNEIRLAMPVFFKNLFLQFNLNLPFNKRNTLLCLLKFIKKIVYKYLSAIFSRLGLFDKYKKIIKLCK